MGFKSGLEKFEEKKRQKIVPTGDDILDQLLSGGFWQDLIHLIFGAARRTTKILLRTCVNAQLIFSEHQNKVESTKVGYIDGMNKFYP